MRSSVPGIWMRRAKNSGLCVETPGAWTASGMPLQQYTCNDTPAQTLSLVQK